MRRVSFKSQMALPLVIAVLWAGIATFLAWAGASQVVFEVSMVAPSGSGHAQLFFDVGRGNVEADSVRVPVTGGGAPNVYRFVLPVTGWRALRFDPVERPNCEVVLSKARIVERGGALVRHVPPSAFSIDAHIERLEVHGNEVRLTMGPNDSDPILAIDTASLPAAAWLSSLLRFCVPHFLSWLFAVFLTGVLLLALAKRFSTPVMAWARQRPCRAILVVAVASSILSCYPVVFFGRSFVSAHVAMLTDDARPLPGMRPSIVEDIKGADLGAMFWQNLPYSFLQSRALGKYNELPLWNRYNSGGVIHLGQALTMFGDPTQWLVLLAGGASWAWDLKFLLAKALFCGGIGLAVFLSTRHLPSSLLLAFSAGFIGFFSFRFSHPAFFSLCYAPWILTCWLGVARAPNLRAAGGWSLGLVAASWAELNSGSAKEAYMLLLCLNGSGLIAFLLAAEGNRGRKFLYLLGAGLVFVLLATPICLTFLVGLTSQFSSYRNTNAYQIQPGAFVGLFDEIFYRRLNSSGSVFGPSANFLVLVGCLLGVVHFRTLWRERLFVALGLGALPVLALTYGIIGPAIIKKIPVLNNVMHIDNTFSCILIVQLLILAGFGLRCLWEQASNEERRVEITMLILAFGGVLGLYLGFTQAYQRGPNTFEPAYQKGVPNAFYHLYVVTLILSALLFPWLVRNLQRSAAVRPGLILLASLCLIALHWRMGMHLHTKVAAIDDSVMNPEPRIDFGVSSPTIDFLKTQEGAFRTVGFGGILFAGYNTMVELESICGPDPLLNPYYRELFSASGMGSDMGWRWRVDKDNLPLMKPFYDFLNIRYFLDDTKSPKISEPSLVALSPMDLQIYENRTAWPRAFFVDRLVSYDKAADLIAMLQQNKGEPLAAVQRDDASAISVVQPLLGDVTEARQVVPARNFRLTNNTTSFTVDAPAAGVVVLTENYIANDFATRVNGKDSDYFRVNHAFRAVKVPAAGTYVISYSYWPGYFTVSLWLAGVGLTLLLTGTVLVWRSNGQPVAANGRGDPIKA